MFSATSKVGAIMSVAVRNWLLSVACLFFALSASEASAADQILRAQVYPGSIVSLPVWVADEGGFCKAEGIECPATPIASGPLAMQALAAGSLEVMFTSTDILMLGASRGNDIILISGHTPDNIYELSMRKDIGLEAKPYPEVMKQFVGKTVGISARGSAVENQMRALLVGAGLDPDSVTYVAVGSPNTAYPAMLSKQIQSAVMWEPFRALCELKKICDIAVDMRKGEGPEILKSLNGGFETFAARREFVNKNKPAIDAFIRAVSNGIAWMKTPENFAKVVAIAKRNSSLGDIENADAVLDKLVRDQIAVYGTKIDRNAIKAFPKFLVAAKLTPTEFDPSRFIYEGAP
jgi:NitT/TauT family transport system substrate-binding protein